MAGERPLRIVHSEAATSFGGQEHRIFKEMVAMRERGHYLEAICQPDAELTRRLRDAGFVVHTMFMDGFVNIVAGIERMRRILKAGRFDVLNTHSRQDTIIAAPAGRLAGTPLIVRTRHLASKVNSLLTYTWLPHCVTTVSEHVRRQLITRGVPEDLVETIYTPVILTPPVAHSTLRDVLGRDRRARSRLPILSGIAEIGDDRRDPPGGRAAQRVDADQQFHEVVVGGIAGRLQHEHVLAADVLVDLDEDLLVGEAADQRVGQRDFEIVGNRLGQRQVGIAGHQFHRARPYGDPGSLRGVT